MPSTVKTLRTLVIIAFGTLFGFGLGAHDAEAAKRFGGGQSIGKQRESIQREAAPRPPSQSPAAAPQTPPVQRPGLGGMLGGLLAGGLLGALLFGGAFDGINFADVAMLALALGGGWLLLRTFARGRAPAPPALQGAPRTGSAMPAPQFGRPLARSVSPSVPEPGAATARRVPAGFDESAFLEQARKAFLRLQAANDSGDRGSIQDFTTPEFFAMLDAQLRARDNAPHKVSVTTLNAELLQVETEGNEATARVLFSGFIRESEEGLPERFEEIWHVVKDLSDPKASWLLAGIQQVN